MHRLVAVAVSPCELRAGSDLIAGCAGVHRIDVLVVTDGDRPGDDPDDDPDDRPDPGVRFRTLAASLYRPGFDVHRLGLAAPIRPGDVPDLVAAVSELVGFDPEPGVGCLVPVAAAPAVRPPDTESPTALALGRAMAQISAVYRLPMRTYVPQSA